MNELVQIAIVAFRAARYRDAIELLLQVSDNDPTDFLARLYLAMTYEKCGRIADAHRLFKRLATDCPDEHIRSRANSALPLIEAEMRRKFSRDQIKASKSQPVQDDDDIVWVG